MAELSFVVCVIAAVVGYTIWRHWCEADGTWHPHNFSTMKRRTPKGFWEYRPMTEQEALNAWEERQ